MVLLFDTDLPAYSIGDIRYRFKLELFVTRPHFSTKKCTEKNVPYKDQLQDVIQSPSFINFSNQVVQKNRNTDSEKNDRQNDINFFPDNSGFKKQPILALTKSMRIDFPSFLVNRVVTTPNVDIKLEIQQSGYYLPRNSTFIVTNVRFLSEFKLVPNSFDLVYLDPPWLNKSVRRGSKYEMVSHEEIFKWINLPTLLANTGFIAIWITNKPTIESFVRQYFKSINLAYKGEWTWVKLAASGETVYPMTSSHKSPTERLLFFAHPDQKPIRKKYIFSIASSIHSRKPLLHDALENEISTGIPNTDFGIKKPKCVEIFARHLRPNWLSIGNEPFFLENDVFYSECE